MLYFDVTKAGGYRHHSGLSRVSRRLRAALGAAAPGGVIDVAWHARKRTFVEVARRRPVAPAAGDWLLTPELFSEAERPGLAAWLQARPCRTAAIYNDAIPLRFPEFTWPHSVARHPYYLKLLASFDRVLAISGASARELAAYWSWLGVRGPEPVAIVLGADGLGRARAEADPRRAQNRSIVMLGIVEPRKNQGALLDAAEALWAEGASFSVAIAGRVNPHFGKPAIARVRQLRRAGRAVEHLDAPDDQAVTGLLAGARFLVLPSLAEGCGLPVLESLWAGVPVLCSDVPSMLESAAGGGCVVVPAGDTPALAAAMRELLASDARIAELASIAAARPLPTWADTARDVVAALV